jgi:hypothetical protein
LQNMPTARCKLVLFRASATETEQGSTGSRSAQINLLKTPLKLVIQISLPLATSARFVNLSAPSTPSIQSDELTSSPTTISACARKRARRTRVDTRSRLPIIFAECAMLPESTLSEIAQWSRRGIKRGTKRRSLVQLNVG